MAETHAPVVVTGGAGFLGQNVVRYLVEQGRECVIVDRAVPSLPAVREAVAARRVGLVLADLTDRRSVAAAELPGRFHLAHVATVIEGTVEIGPAATTTLGFHAGMCMNLADAFGDRLLSFTYTSSFEVYGVHTRLPLDETHETNPINVYGIGKLMAEDYLRVFCRTAGIPLTILRLSHLYGPGEWHNKAIPNFIKNCIARRPHCLFGGGRDIREPVNVRDVAYAILLSLDRTREGTFNIAGGRSLTIRELLEAVERVFGADPLPVEERPVDRPALDVCFDLTRARQELGYVPQVSLEEGVREEIEWLESLETGETGAAREARSEIPRRARWSTSC